MQQKPITNTVIIYSSARKKGNTSLQVNEYKAQYGGDVVCLDDYVISPYCYDKQYKNDDFYAVFEALLNYQHWVLASPVYWYNTTPQFKAFLDRITDYMDDETLRTKLRTLREKQFSLLSNAGSAHAPNAFIEMFKNTFNYLGMTFKAHQHIDAS
ncbi:MULTISPECIES: flavodoxin family protein [Pseudoalteromonas]|uniref:flavodoxin family protein n=1 Tax=Pseudoalteromonas TaxID=53246 RepID=UPI0006C9ECA1|nr:MULTISPECIES: flavodoxin family protein [Pseudoalteromonas]KPM77482.1 FMN reductase [Pseudoalteromonas sp. UCD-33C]MDK9682812.1 flavodoxin family protein [Pseudoalteromonas shioyasakiensis]